MGEFEAMHDPQGQRHRKVNHMALETTNFDAVLEKLKDYGISWGEDQIVLVKVPGEDVVMRQLFLPDPDGHYVEICECYKLNDFVYGAKKKIERRQCSKCNGKGKISKWNRWGLCGDKCDRCEGTGVTEDEQATSPVLSELRLSCIPNAGRML